jgi:hypothetical protein
LGYDKNRDLLLTKSIDGDKMVATFNMSNNKSFTDTLGSRIYINGIKIADINNNKVIYNSGMEDKYQVTYNRDKKSWIITY